jgi:hypothetical protein
VEPGDFLKAVFENDFVDAFKNADEENILLMQRYASFLYNHLPLRDYGVVWGSKKAVKEWTYERQPGSEVQHGAETTEPRGSS